ncbi:NAD(P)/FAD-dependent oxidoreductase [Pararhodobacter zhoushanensis]|uniref:NAD(P)/FAD-dependent oxidoreductase n=1 Tax=Pararhodobacter zhoushanensis TaxID=2479545 RepID=UPI000F8D924A|nr:NAD(P)/FAD-dependent oxidoreductase [Pararhodobacter zhoushanensis]
MPDVIIIGGGYAGMAAALQLLRARRDVLIIDAGQRRNRFASHAHGFLTQDGEDPAVIAARARAQIEAYPDLDWYEGEATRIDGEKGNFVVLLSDGAAFSASRVILALGVSDTLPEIPGLAERWGQSVFHCPYCHGYELNRGRIGVIASGPEITGHVGLFSEWGEVTLLVNGAFSMNDDHTAAMRGYGITVEETPIAAIEGQAEVVLSDNRRLQPFAGLFVTSRAAPATGIAQAAELSLAETPMGQQIDTDSLKETSRPGIYACGDAARVPHSLALAIADGSWAGATVHRSLVFDH